MQTLVATCYFDIYDKYLTNIKNKVERRVKWKTPRELVCLPSVGGHLHGIRCRFLDACKMALLGDLVQTKERLFSSPASLGIPERRKGGSLLS